MTEEEGLVAAEKRYQETKQKESDEQLRKNDIAIMIFERMKARIHPETMEKLRDEVAQETFGIGSPEQIEAELDYRLLQLLKSDIEKKLKSATKMDEPSRHILRYMLETTMADMSAYVQTIRQFPLNDLLLNPSTINDLISTCESWNLDIEKLHTVDIKYKVLEPATYPLEKSQLSIWVQNIQANKIFTASWFDSQRTALRRFLNE